MVGGGGLYALALMASLRALPGKGAGPRDSENWHTEAIATSVFTGRRSSSNRIEEPDQCVALCSRKCPAMMPGTPHPGGRVILEVPVPSRRPPCRVGEPHSPARVR